MVIFIVLVLRTPNDDHYVAGHHSRLRKQFSMVGSEDLPKSAVISDPDM